MGNIFSFHKGLRFLPKYEADRNPPTIQPAHPSSQSTSSALNNYLIKYTVKTVILQNSITN